MIPILTDSLKDLETPTLEDIRTCCEKAKQNNCIIHLWWYVQYSGWYDVFLFPESNPEEVFEKEVPQVYGI